MSDKRNGGSGAYLTPITNNRPITTDGSLTIVVSSPY